MRLEPLIQPSLTFLVLNAPSRDTVLAEIAARGEGVFPNISRERFMSALVERESKYPTGTPEGVAFPHALLPDIPTTAVVCALARPGVRWNDPSLPEQHLIFGILGNDDAPWEHVRLLARLARLIRAQGAMDLLRNSADASQLFDGLVQEDRRHG